tara:strand:- start:230 stop:691 length:462 start_codon:yes stop_codon:yes gene_type:complete
MSNEMKLIMENWRNSQLLLEADEKKVLDFLKNVTSGNLQPQQAKEVFDKLQQNSQFKDLAQFFSEIESLPVDEGIIDDAMASISVKGMTIIDALKTKPEGQKLVNATPAIMALAYAAVKFSQGELEAGDLESIINILKKGSQASLIDIASAGG